jgi:predicted SnoaL-like aldol condensation-catalyzing enzyme
MSDLGVDHRFERAEVEAAFADFCRRGVGSYDWPGWASIFTEDALYEEHFMGTFHGAATITEWIVAAMKDYPAMSLWMEWVAIEDDHICFYIWNNLPDPTGGTERYGFPNTTMLRYAGHGKFDWEADFYNPADAEKVFVAWLTAGGRKHTPMNRSLEGIEGWLPEPSTEAFSREEIEREFEAYRARGRLAVETGDWDQWADQFTDDARYLEHHYGRFEGQAAIRAWITGVMKPFPMMAFPLKVAVIEGNRVGAIIPNVLPDPSGGDGYFGFDVNVVLHYAGNGKWSYEEDVYNPREAQDVITAWIAAGGVIPK